MACTSVHPSLRKLNEETKEHLERRAVAERETAVLRERTGVLQKRVDALLAESKASAAKCAEIEAARATTAEQLSVAQSERKMMNEMLTRADVTLKELRTERDALLTRNESLQAECTAQQQARILADKERAQAECDLGVARAEKRLADEGAEATAALLEQARARATDSEARVRWLESSLEQVRVERGELQQKMAVAVAERRMLDEAVGSVATQADVARQTMRDRIAEVESRAAEAAQAKEAAEGEKASVEKQLAVVSAERKAAQEAADEKELKYQREKASRERAETSNLELEKRLRDAERAAQSTADKLMNVEEEHRTLHARFTHAAAHVRVLQSERSGMEAELARRDAHGRQLDYAAADRYVARSNGLGEWVMPQCLLQGDTTEAGRHRVRA